MHLVIITMVILCVYLNSLPHCSKYFKLSLLRELKNIYVIFFLVCMKGLLRFIIGNKLSKFNWADVNFSDLFAVSGKLFKIEIGCLYFFF